MQIFGKYDVSRLVQIFQGFFASRQIKDRWDVDYYNFRLKIYTGDSPKIEIYNITRSSTSSTEEYLFTIIGQKV